MKVSPIVGLRSLKVLNAFRTLVLGLRMIPEHALKTLEEFTKEVQEYPEEEKLTALTHAVSLISLNPDEVEACLYFVTDANGVPFAKQNVNNLSPDQLVKAVVLVCMEISKIKIDMLSEYEKKN